MKVRYKTIYFMCKEQLEDYISLLDLDYRDKFISDNNIKYEEDDEDIETQSTMSFELHVVLHESRNKELVAAYRANRLGFVYGKE